MCVCERDVCHPCLCSGASEAEGRQWRCPRSPASPSPPAGAPSGSTGCLLQSLSLGLAACPSAGKGKEEARPGGPGPGRPARSQPRTLCPGRGPMPGCSCSSREGLEGPLWSLSPGVSTQRGAQPCRPSWSPQGCFLLLFALKPEKMSQVPGKGGSSWGPGPLDPSDFWLGMGRVVVRALEDALRMPPSHSGHGRFSRFRLFPHSFLVLLHTPSSS